MSVITISREAFSGGVEVAECVAQALGYRAVDREVIVERVAAHGLSQDEVRDAFEKPPTLLQRFPHKSYLYLVLIQAALLAEVRPGKVVYHGNAGHLLLKGGPRILRVRLIAPMEQRVKLAEDRLKLTRPEAQDHLARLDQDRRKWTQALYGVDWGDPANFDMVLNLEQMAVGDAALAIVALAGQNVFQFTERSQLAMDDLALASQIRVDLALDPATSQLEFEVDTREGAVRIRGTISSLRELADIERIASAVTGVKQLDLDELSATVSA